VLTSSAHAGEKDRLEQAVELYERAVFGGDRSVIDKATHVLDTLEADLLLARGRIVHAKFLDDREEDPREGDLFENSARLYHALGNVAGEGEALFWLGTYHQVVRADEDAALPHLQRAHELATAAGDRLLLSYVVRHLGFADMAAGRMDAAWRRLEESLRLRQELGYWPGVAAGLLALAQLAAEAGRMVEVQPLLDEAMSVAERSGADGVRSWIERFRASL
jgi:tetratricopeptide (TPR) repeat protein